ncbi:hypothetical protein F4823DRAFT_568037 [Ustulina deusta]|nr:hypothetical protein F4823DRAFT_568037 [Ustulina deusta]
MRGSHRYRHLWRGGLAKEKNVVVGRQRRVALKRALGAGIDKLKMEVATSELHSPLSKVILKIQVIALTDCSDGACARLAPPWDYPHFATILASCEDMADFANSTVTATGLRKILVVALHGLCGPAFVQEHCESGTLDSLEEKAEAQGNQIPKRPPSASLPSQRASLLPSTPPSLEEG